MGVVRKVLGLVAAIATIATLYAPHAFAATGTISGVVFQDVNRNGIHDPGEAGFGGHMLQVDDGSGRYLQTVTADANGAFVVSGLTDGNYTLQSDASSWNSLRDQWVPTNTGSVFPVLHVALAGSAQANLGWRQINVSTSLGYPITSYTGPEGIRADSYTDALDARTIHDALIAGSLIGAEAPYVTIRFGYDSVSATSSSATKDSTGKYTNYHATSSVTYDSWLDGTDQTLFHEYGHAWSMYFAYIVQQDPTLAGYLQARGLASDSRVDSSYPWNRGEMIAEDYRELFGTANAQAAAQMNRDIPTAQSVSGLAEYLSGSFRSGAGTSGSTGTTTTTVAAPTISTLAMSPTPVTKSGTASFALASAATTTIKITTSKGATVRTLLSAASEPSGSVSVVWDRLDDYGRRVKSATYLLVVDTNNSGGTDHKSVSFSVQ